MPNSKPGANPVAFRNQGFGFRSAENSSFGRLGVGSGGGRLTLRTLGRAFRDRKPYSSVRRSRSAFMMTDTELNVIAALAIIGLSTNPKNG